MKKLSILLAAPLLALAACGSGDAGNNVQANGADPANLADPAASDAANASADAGGKPAGNEAAPADGAAGGKPTGDEATPAEGNGAKPTE